jgi:hypothetical protein
VAAGGSTGPFATLTHARVRAGQGDIAGAKRILRVILDAQPDHAEARAMLDGLSGRADVAYREPVPEPAVDPISAAAVDLAPRFRETLARGKNVERLKRWGERLHRNREKRRVR